MTSREEFEAAMINHLIADGFSEDAAPLMLERGLDGRYRSIRVNGAYWGWMACTVNADLLSALQSILNSGPDAMPIKEAFEVGHRVVARALGDRV